MPGHHPVGNHGYFYPRPPRGGRLRGRVVLRPHSSISIHALREEGDLTPDGIFGEGTEFLSTPSARRATFEDATSTSGGGISIHALREEGDRLNNKTQIFPLKFLSTPSARRATNCSMQSRKRQRNFYPRPPRGGRQDRERLGRQGQGISIHALREEGDGRKSRRSSGRWYFYPRPPRGGRPSFMLGTLRATRISIHALREEGDARTHRERKSEQKYFYPRPPRGGRRRLQPCIIPPQEFLSTPSARRATKTVPPPTTAETNFYPRPPRGGRPFAN